MSLLCNDVFLFSKKHCFVKFFFFFLLYLGFFVFPLRIDRLINLFFYTNSN